MARGVALGARVYATKLDNASAIHRMHESLTRDDAQIMADFVRANPEAPVDAMSIHLALTRRQPRGELSAVDRFALKLFHQAVTAAIAFDKEIEAINLAKLQPQPIGHYPGRQSFVPEPAPFAPTGFQTVR